MAASEDRRTIILAMVTEAAKKLGRIVAMFPSQKAAVLELALSDPDFRDLLDDLGDAHDSLAHFEALPDLQERPEIAEYRAIISELEAEMRTYVAAHVL